MSSAGSRPEDIRDRLKTLERETRELWHLIKCREKSIDAVEGTVNSTECAITDLMNLIGCMEYEINQCTDKLIEIETTRVDLLAERDTLQEQLNNRTRQPLTANITLLKPHIEMLETERAKRDDAREMLFEKKNELELAVDRKREVENQINRTMESLREKVNGMDKERKSYVDDLDSFDTIRMDNLNHVITSLPEGMERSDVEICIEWLDLMKEQRDLTIEEVQLEFDCQYQVHETTKALGVKKTYMKRLEDISQEYHEMMVLDGVDTGFYVRETDACPDLHNTDDHIMAVDSTSDIILEETDDATTLHHTSQRTDLHQNIEGDEDLLRYAAEMEKNMSEYMAELKLGKPTDVQGTLYEDTVVNLQDAALEFKQDPNSPEDEDSSREPEPPEEPEKPSPQSTRKLLPGNMESSHINQASVTAKIRGRLGLNLDRSRAGGSSTLLKGSSIKATGSATFAKLRKK